jgi:hypothetical protein
VTHPKPVPWRVIFEGVRDALVVEGQTEEPLPLEGYEGWMRKLEGRAFGAKERDFGEVVSFFLSFCGLVFFVVGFGSGFGFSANSDSVLILPLSQPSKSFHSCEVSYSLRTQKVFLGTGMRRRGMGYSL